MRGSFQILQEISLIKRLTNRASGKLKADVHSLSLPPANSTRCLISNQGVLNMLKPQRANN